MALLAPVVFNHLPAGQFLHVDNPVVSAYFPSGHGPHVFDVLPGTLENVPGLHEIHVVALLALGVSDHLPAGQFLHMDNPVASAYFPASHGVHTVADSLRLYLPVAHGEQPPVCRSFFVPGWHVTHVGLPCVEVSCDEQFVQEIAPAPAYLPGPHITQSVLLVEPVDADDCPAGQSVHVDKPAVSAYVPAEQCVQLLAPTPDDFPAVQFLQDAKPATFWNFPAGQSLQDAKPLTSWYVPVVQFLHVLELFARPLPVPCLPMSHFVQFFWPVWS